MKSLVLLFSLLVPSQFSQQIVVTASDVPETVASTPASVTVITQKDIEQRAARDVADVLREVPGLSLARSGSAGKATSLFTRGAASTQTLVLWNGIEINNPYFSGFDWGRFSTAGIERVEVVRGPFSALYGSEAMAGVVNILTPPQRNRFNAEVQAGGRGLRNETVEGSWSSGPFALSAAADHRQDEGSFANDDFRQNDANVLARWSPTSALTLGIAARHTSYDIGIPFNTDATGAHLIPSLGRRQEGRESQIAVPISLDALGLTSDLTLSGDRRSDDFRDPDDPFTTSTTTNSTAKRIRFTTRSGVTSFGTIVGGGEYEKITVSDLTNFGPNFLAKTRTDRALFVEDRVAVSSGSSQLQLSLGVRHDSFASFGSQTSPRVAMAWISGSDKFRAAYGQGFRAPSVGELYYPFFGNANLKAEHDRSFELGYDRVVGTGAWSATYFNSRYRDLITFDPTTFISENIGRVHADGIELGAQQPLSATLSLAASYTYLHRADDETTGQRLTRRPKHSGSLFVGWHRGNVDAAVVLLRTGAREDHEAVYPFALVTNRGYTTVDANVQVHLGSFTPFVKIENLHDAHYEEVLGYASPHRRAIAGVRFTM